jgi:drug/metabolite transporter (DMT)-like permease
MASDETVPSVVLLSAVLIWGTTFVLVKDTLQYVDPLSLVASRFAIAFLVLLAALLYKKEKVDFGTARDGAILGILLLVGYASQTIGLNYTTPSKSAFITGLFVVLIPVFMLFLGKRLARREWMAAIVAFAGLALLTYKPGFETNFGDMITLVTAASFALQIIFIGEYVKTRNLHALITVQLGVVAIIGMVLAGLTGPRITAQAVPAILFLAFFATFFGFIAQAWAQKRVAQVKAGIILAMEPVFAALFSYVTAAEQFSAMQIAGSLLILAGIMLASTKRG